jgi:hypothetical protein
MSTSEALRERKWGRFPALRQALEGRTLSPEYFGWSSVSDNVFEAVPRTLEIGMLARDSSECLCGAALHTGWHAMHRDLEGLVNELEAAGALLHRLADDVRALHRLEYESPRYWPLRAG